MTNRDMVKPGSGTGPLQTPNTSRRPPVPADEDSRTPTTLDEPIDSPQPGLDHERPKPPEGEIGLATTRKR